MKAKLFSLLLFISCMFTDSVLNAQIAKQPTKAELIKPWMSVRRMLLTYYWMKKGNRVVTTT